MRIFELVLAGAFALLGLRSLVHWIRRPFESTDPRDHLWFAAFVIGRVGAWWAMAGFFLLSATLRDPNGTGEYLQGRAFADIFRDRFGWYPFIVIGCMVLQFLAAFVLGHRASRGDGAPDAE